MNKVSKIILPLIGLIFSVQVFGNQSVWSTSGFSMPESVEYDKKNDRYYVSNVNGGVNQQDNNGTISLLDGKGKLLKADWVTKLHSPKGLALFGNKLFVADVKQLVVINVEEEKIVARYEASDSIILNGITINRKGEVFVSDWMGNSIYSLDNGELKPWLRSKKLNSPNGLWVDDDYLYVASWGSNPNPKAHFTTETSGGIKKISLKEKTIETLKQGKRWINMDGISSYSENKWLVSDFIKGEILLINNKGEVEKSVVVKKGSADFFYVKEKNLLVIPLMMDNKVVAYTL